jgi:hypothetical protein
MRLFLISIMCLSLAACGYVTGRGEKVGTIIKLSKEGVFVKTWEAEIIRGGMSNGSGGFSSTPFFFTIDDNALLAKVQTAFDSQKEIKIHYKRRAYFWTFTSECHAPGKDNMECNYLTGIN